MEENSKVISANSEEEGMEETGRGGRGVDRGNTLILNYYVRQLGNLLL
jgi:hypothetical protein